MGKALHPITTWSQYHKFRINCGSLTFWVDVEVIDNWFHHAHHKQQGSSQLYTDKTIVMTYWLIWAITPLPPEIYYSEQLFNPLPNKVADPLLNATINCPQS